MTCDANEGQDSYH